MSAVPVVSLPHDADGAIEERHPAAAARQGMGAGDAVRAYLVRSREVR